MHVVRVKVEKEVRGAGRFKQGEGGGKGNWRE